MDIKIYTDTAADLTQEEINELGVSVIDMPVIVDGEDEPTTNLDEFWAKMEEGKFARTSQPSPEVFREAFQSAKDGGYAIFMILISDKLSGTYDNACFIKEQVGYEHIYIFNSLYASSAEKLMVYEAVKLKKQGLSINEIAEKISELRSKIVFFGVPETLTSLARGGRISKATAMIGNLIKLKPILHCNDEGYIVVHSKVIGLDRTIIKIADKVLEDNYNPEYPILMFYAKEEKNAKKLADRLAGKGVTVEEKAISPVGPTIGTHYGIGAFGIAFVRQ